MIPKDVTDIIINYLQKCIECNDIVQSDYAYYNNYHTVFTTCKCDYRYCLCLNCISKLIINQAILYPLVCNNKKCNSIVFIAQTFKTF